MSAVSARPDSAGWVRVAACSLALADLAYAIRHPATPRYPFNYFADASFVVAFGAFAATLAEAPRKTKQRRLRRTQGRRMGHPLAVWVAAAGVAALALALQQIFVLRPMAQLACVPRTALALAWCYSGTTAWVAARLLLLGFRAQRRRTIWATHGLLLVLASDFLCRHLALVSRVGGTNLGELGWVMGLGLVAAVQNPPGTRRGSWPVAAAGPRAPWLSVRTLLALVVAATVPVALLGGVVAGLFAVPHAHRAGSFLLVCWATTLFANLTAQKASYVLGGAAKHRDPKRFLAATKASRLSELDAVWLARRRDARWGATAADVAHDMRGPAAALFAAATNLGRGSAGPLAGLVTEAAVRLRHLTEQLLAARREAVGRRTSPRALPRSVAARPARSDGVRSHAVALLPLLGRALLEARLRGPALAAGCLSGRPWLEVAGPRAGARRRLRPVTGSLWITACPQTLALALGHLLDNALEAPRRPNTRVRLLVRLRANAVVVTVADTAVGMELAKLARARGQGLGLGQKPGGNGLGLARVARAARTMGTRLELRSRAQVGTRASLSFALVPMRGRGVHILVDDDPLVRKAWRLAAAAAGARACCCSTAAACLRLVARLGGRPGGGDGGREGVRLVANAAFYVDHHLGPGLAGRALRRRLRAAGFVHVRPLLPDKTFDQNKAGGPKGAARCVVRKTADPPQAWPG